jgi:hypothetical protein
MMSAAYRRFAGMVSYLVAIGGLAYSVLFVIAVKADSGAAETASWALLMVGGLLSTAVLVALYQLLRDVEAGFAMWGLLLGFVGAAGSIIHGGFELARVIPSEVPLTLPANPVDPRGLLTFGAAGVGLTVLSALIRRIPALPSGLGALGIVLGILLVLVYLGRLFIVDPNEPVLLGLAAVTGVLAHPAFFLWLGSSLRRGAEHPGLSSPAPDQA